MTEQTTCPDPARWQELLDGSLPESEQQVLGAHLEHCPRCQKALERSTCGSETWVDVARNLADEAHGNEPALRRVMAELEAEIDQPAMALEHDKQNRNVDDCEEIPLSFLSPADNADQLGRLGHYAVSEVIGRGGMGIVLKAFDEKLQRVVAIKVMAAQLAASSSARKRFIREAQSAAAVRNEHVIAIHAVEDANRLPYLVMEYISGRSLQERIDQTGPLELNKILRIGMQTACGLAAAHAQGLIHRDVKPANILLENGVERVKLTDFGLARAVDDCTLTQSGVVAGTPDYMAPEQARGLAVDHRSDLFSLGSVLYAMCTGQPPFGAGNALATLKRLCDEEPRSIRQLNPEIPDWLSDVVNKLLAKDPAQRFQSATELADLLERYLAHLQQPTLAPMPGEMHSPPAKRRRRRWTIALVALLVGSACIVVTEAIGLTHLMATVRRAFVPTVKPVAKPAPPVPKVEPAKPAPPWFETVAKLSADEQAQAVAARLQELNPDFDGHFACDTIDGVVKRFELDGGEVSDISPVRLLAGLKVLDCRTEKPGKLKDLSPLQGLLLSNLNCRNSQVADLAPLRGMPLNSLNLSHSQISDLSPLKNLPLTLLQIDSTPVKEISPLQGMPLRRLYVHDTGVSDLSPLTGMRLEELWCGNTLVTDLSPLKGMPLKMLSCRNTSVRDLSPLRDMPLQTLLCSSARVLEGDVIAQNLEVLRSLKSLTMIADQPAAQFLERAEQMLKP